MFFSSGSYYYNNRVAGMDLGEGFFLIELDIGLVTFFSRSSATHHWWTAFLLIAEVCVLIFLYRNVHLTLTLQKDSATKKVV